MPDTPATFHIESGVLVIRQNGAIVATFPPRYFRNIIVALVDAMKEAAHGSPD